MSIFRVFEKNRVHTCLHANREIERIGAVYPFPETENLFYAHRVNSPNLKITRGDRAVLYGKLCFSLRLICAKNEIKTVDYDCSTRVTRPSFVLSISPCFPVYGVTKFIAHETEVSTTDFYEKANDTDGGGRFGCAFYTAPPARTDFAGKLGPTLRRH